MNLQNRKIGIFGIQQSGKTTLAKKLIRGFKNPLVYEMHPDFRSENCSVYRPKDFTLATLDAFCLKVKQLALKKKVDCFVIDEFDMFCNGNAPLPTNLNDLVINHAHYGLSLIFISRRFQDIPPKVVESCHFMFIFMIEGVNAVQRIKMLHPEMEKCLSQLSFERRNFILKELGQTPTVCSPVTL